MAKAKIIVNGTEYEVDVRLADKTAFLRDPEPPPSAFDALFTGSVTTTVDDDAMNALLGDAPVEPPKLVMLVSGENLSPEFRAWLNGDSEEKSE